MNDLLELQSYIESGHNLLETGGFESECALHGIVKKGSKKLLEAFLEHDIDLEQKDYSKGYTALMYAMIQGYYFEQEIITMSHLLLDMGADIETICKHNNNTPLIAASQCNLSLMVTSLLTRDAQVNALNRYGLGGLHYAVMKPYLDVFQVLIRFGAIENIEQRNACIALIVSLKTPSEEIKATMRTLIDDQLNAMQTHSAAMPTSSNPYVLYQPHVSAEATIDSVDPRPTNT